MVVPLGWVEGIALLHRPIHHRNLPQSAFAFVAGFVAAIAAEIAAAKSFARHARVSGLTV